MKKMAGGKELNTGLVFLTGFLSLFAILRPAPAAAAAEATEDFEIRPIYQFEYKSARDPFEPRHKREAAPAVAEIDISTFSLMGVTESGGIQAALFRNRNGNPFGYIFMDGKLYGENDRVITGVAGEIRDSGEVLLIQGDREVLFRLNETINGPNIRPEVNNKSANN